MVDFIRVESDDFKVPELLLARVSGFEDSKEYAVVDESEKGLLTIVMDSFASFFLRLQAAALEGDLDQRDTKSLADSYAVIELLAGLHDHGVNSLLEDCVYWDFADDDSCRIAIESRLGPESITHYSRWRKGQAGR